MSELFWWCLTEFGIFPVFHNKEDKTHTDSSNCHREEALANISFSRFPWTQCRSWHKSHCVIVRIGFHKCLPRCLFRYAEAVWIEHTHAVARTAFDTYEQYAKQTICSWWRLHCLLSCTSPCIIECKIILTYIMNTILSIAYIINNKEFQISN